MADEKSKSSRHWVLVTLLVVILCIGVVFIFSIRSSVAFIEPTQRGVVISALAPTGYRAEILAPGYHFVIPYFESVITYDIAPQKYEMGANSGEKPGPIEATTSDDRQVFVDISVVYAVDPEKVLDMHMVWQDRYQSELVRPLSRDITCDLIARFTFGDTTRLRKEIQQDIFEELGEVLEENGIILMEVNLLDIVRAEE